MIMLKKYFKAILGCILISLGLRIFIIPSSLVVSGALGLSSLLYYNYGFNISILLLIINVWTIWLVYMLYDIKKLKEYLIPSIALPVFIYMSSFININLTSSVEILLLALFGSFIMGYGYSIMYKEGYKVGAINILEDIYNDLNRKNTKIITRCFDFILIISTLFSFGLERTLYSMIVVIVIRYMTTKASIGISDFKAFYIITTHEKEIKDYIMNELHYDLTLFDVEGGFTKKKNKILMTVIPTKDYFRLKQGIKLIDSKAFISITDNYEVMNKDLDINVN